MDSSQDSNRPEVFRIRILSIISPQDFWIQKIPKDKSDTDNTVIRAGIYGLFPTKTQFLQQKDEFTIHKSKYWTHTTKVWFTKFMENITSDILFVPKAVISTEYSTDGLSPICMYGEVYILKNGNLTSMLKILHNQRLAYKSDTQFQRYLKEDRLPAILTQEEISLVKCAITKIIPDFEVGDHIRYRQQQMNKYRPVGDRQNQAKVAKETMTIALRYFQRSKQEIDALLKRKEEDWNAGVEDADQYVSVYSRKDVIERRRLKAQSVSTATEEFTVVPEIAEIDKTEICENYTLHPAGMSLQNQVKLKKNKDSHSTLSHPGSLPIATDSSENINKSSRHLAESTPESRLSSSSFEDQNEPDFSTSDMTKSLLGNKNSQNDIAKDDDEAVISRKVSSNYTENESYISSERLLKKVDFSEISQTMSVDALDLSENSSCYKDDGYRSRKCEIKKSSTDKSLLDKSLKDYSQKRVELPPLWVKHQDKDINETTAAELKNLLGAPEKSLNQPENIKKSSVISSVSETRNVDSESTCKTFETCHSNDRKKYIILKDTSVSDDDSDPNIVEDEFNEDQLNSSGCSVVSHESSFGSKPSSLKDNLLHIPRYIYNFLWTSPEQTDVYKVATDNESEVVEISSDVSSSVKMDDKIVNERSGKEILNDINEEDDGGGIFSVPPGVRIETSNVRQSGMGLVERIVEPKVLMHSPNTFRIGLWTTMLKTAFPTRIRDCLSVMKIKIPNRLQMATWPAMMRGHSCTIIGPANSGKTLGVLAPLCSSIADFENVECSHGPIGLIIVPNMKAAFAAYGMCCSLLRGTKLDGKPLKILRVSSMAHSYTVRKVSEGCDILIMTSTAFLEFSDSKLSVLDLSRLKMLVFDDVDVLYSQYNDDVDKIFSRCCSDRNFQFQVAFTAKRWMEQFRPLLKVLDIPIICISAFQECILYSKVEVVTKMVVKDLKSDYLVKLLKDRLETHWKLIIICVNDEEVFKVYETLKDLHYSVEYLNTLSNIEDVRNAHRIWDGGNLQALVCCDMNLSHINVLNATWLINYSLPNKFSTFNTRFVTMMDSYPNIFAEDPLKTPLRIDVFIDSDNTEQLPKIINFITRCGTHIPDSIKSLSENIFNLQDKKRAYKGIELCDELLSFGKCNDAVACNSRHSIVNKDSPAEWIPSSGTVIFKVLAVHRPDLLSVQLIENVSLDGVVQKYEQKHIEIAFKLTAYFSIGDNVRAHGNVEVNDIAAIKVSTGTSYERCQVVKICTRNSTGGPDTIIVNLLEMETLLETKAYNLHYLPDNLKAIVSHVVRVRIIGMKPSVENVFWTDSSVREASKILTDKSNRLFTRGNIVLVIGKTIFFQTIQCCQRTKTEELVEVKLNYTEHMTTNRCVCENPSHLVSLRRLCDKFNYKYPINKVSKVAVRKLSPPKPQWAHLDENEYHEVYISSAVTPNQLYIRAVKQQDLLDDLVKDLQAYVHKRQSDLLPRHKRVDWNFDIGTYCLAKFPDDDLYCRVRIEKVLEQKTVSPSSNTVDIKNVNENSYECFFVDFGDWRIIDFEDLCPISLELMKRLPFLAIECRLYGIQPKHGSWCEDSSDLLYDLSFEDNSEDLKPFYVRFHKKETAEKTLGSKYAVLLYESSNSSLINNVLLAKGLALEFDDESKFIEEDKKDLNKWLNLQTVKNVIDDDFDNVSDAPSPIPDFVLKSEKHISHHSSLSSFSDLSDAYANKLIPYGVDNVQIDNSLSEVDFSFENWDCQFDKEDAKLITSESRSIHGFDRLGAFPKIIEDFEHIDNPTDIKQRATITEIIEHPDLKESIKTVKNNQITTTKQTVLPVVKFPDENKLQFRIPYILWYQTEKEVILKIKLTGVQNYSLIIDKNSVSFESVLDDINYKFKLDLFNGIVMQNSSHQIIGSYIRVKLAKLRCVSWYQLYKGIDNKFSWVSYDHDHIDDNCDDETTEKIRMAKEAMRAKVELIQRVHQIEMDGGDSDDEIVSTDMYSSKMNRMKREVMPFDPDDVYPDRKILEEPLDF